MTTGTEEIAAERQRQIDEEGFTPDHDSEFDHNLLAMMAACYATPITLNELDYTPPGVRLEAPMPFAQEHDKRHWTPDGLSDNANLPPEDRRRQLIKAGALCAAAIDRLDTQNPPTKPPRGAELIIADTVQQAKHYERAFAAHESVFVTHQGAAESELIKRTYQRVTVMGGVDITQPKQGRAPLRNLIEQRMKFYGETAVILETAPSEPLT